LSICQKGAKWADPEMTIPTWDEDVGKLVAVELFEPRYAANNIHKHIEWDKAKG